MRKKIIISFRLIPVLLAGLLLGGTVRGQSGTDTGIGRQGDGRQDNGRLAIYQDSLAALGKRIMSDPFGPERIEANYQFIQTLVRALQVPGSYDFPFRQVENMRILQAPDHSFRIMTWYVDRGQADYRFYGAIQMNAPELRLFGLVDHTSEFARPTDSITGYGTWYGAYYYEIIPAERAGKKYYVLLGWKGQDARVSSRVAEVLHFEKGEPVFGLPVFHGRDSIPARLVFRYSSQASMMLDYLPGKKLIVFDHLEPAREENTGNYEFYGPDLSYDGYRLQNGEWVLVEDLKLENRKNESDKLFNDPEKLREQSAP